jgi:hypothetical protein
MHELSKFWRHIFAICLICPFYFGIQNRSLFFAINSGAFEGKVIPLPFALLILTYLIVLNWRKIKFGLMDVILVSWFVVQAVCSDWIRVIQVMLFYFYIKIYDNIKTSDLLSVLGMALVYAAIMLQLHLISYAWSFLFLGMNSGQSFEHIFLLPIYAAHLHYVAAIFLLIIASNFYAGFVPKIVTNLSVIVLLLSQRTGMLLLLILNLILRRRYALIALLSLGFLLGYLFVPPEVNTFGHTIAKLHGHNGGLDGNRVNIWMNFVSNIDNVRQLFFGLHRFDIKPHNYWLQLINTGGLVMFSIVAYFFWTRFYLAWRVCKGEKSTPFLLFVTWFVADTSVNLPITQPYVIGIAMLLLVLMGRLDLHVHDNHLVVLR